MRAAEIVLAGWAAAGFGSAAGETLAIENPEGGVHVVIIPGESIDVNAQASGRAITKEDVRVEKTDETYFIDVFPPDLASIDLFARVPYGWPLAIKTVSGNVTIKGNAVSASVETGTGGVSLEVPIQTTALFVKSEERPGALSLPAGSGYRQAADVSKGFRIETEKSRAGTVEIQAFSPSRIVVQDYLPAHDFQSGGPIPLELARPLLRALRSQQNRAGPAGGRRVMVSLRANTQAVRPGAGGFAVIENGEPRPVAEVQPGGVGVNVVVIFQRFLRQGFGGRAPRRVREFLQRLISRVRDADRIALMQAEGGFVRVLSKASIDRGKLLQAYAAAARSESGSELLAAAVLAHKVFDLGDFGKKNAVVVVNAAGDFNCMTRVPDDEIAGAVEVLARSGVPFYAVGGDCKDFERLAKLSGGRSIDLSPGKAEEAADRLAADLASLYAVTYDSRVPAGTMPDRVVVKVQGRNPRMRRGPAVPRPRPQ